VLSAQSLPVVRATLPAVAGSLDAITAAFYRRLFDDRPELLRDLFNRANQASGTQRQALAGAVAAFAALLVQRPGERPDALLGRIAHKHASLGVTADQYALVGRHLLDAVGEVLGDAVTPQVAAAWREVYWLMANALVAIEAGLYARAGVAEGDVWREMEIAGRTRQGDDAVSLTLRRTDGLPTGPFGPGQYVSVQVELPDGARQIRQYSLSAAPDRKTWRITVKRERGTSGLPARPDGEVSGRLPGAAFHVWYEDAAGAPDAVAGHPVRQGRADLTGLPLPAGTTAYLCGPLPFMRAVRGQLLAAGLDPAAVHYEVFGPDLWRTAELPAAGAA
jgi:nitric oxide dioxygenase